VLLVALWAALPWVHVGGRPAMFLDVPGRRFFLFGASFNAQDFWLTFFLATGAIFALVVVTALLGRAWCGWACPQTVFLELFYRPIERWIEGPRNERIARRAAPFGLDRAWRAALKHFLFLFASVLVAHVFLAYFVSLPSLFEMVTRSPTEHPEAFAWMAGTSLVLYGNFSWFREQLCLVVCPYGRLQSVLFDDDSLVVGYDAARGEPRGKARGRAKAEGAGDCVDCNRCVVVCPTGIDIRNGLQVDCIACSQCVDACDEVMDKLHRPRGLVRYDSLRGLRGERRRILRPRIALYAALGVVGVAAAAIAVHARTSFEANLLRLPGAPYVVDRGDEAGADRVRNQFEIHLVNKLDEARTLRIEVVDGGGAEISMGEPAPRLAALESRAIAIVVREPREGWRRGRTLRVRVIAEDGETAEAEAPLLGPAL
jgi:cytochrome c oxidase accessory protein FixG